MLKFLFARRIPLHFVIKLYTKQIKNNGHYFLALTLLREPCGHFPGVPLSLTNGDDSAAALAGARRRFRGGLPSSSSKPPDEVWGQSSVSDAAGVGKELDGSFLRDCRLERELESPSAPAL